jgi:hypothetical protein
MTQPALGARLPGGCDLSNARDRIHRTPGINPGQHYANRSTDPLEELGVAFRFSVIPILRKDSLHITAEDRDLLHPGSAESAQERGDEPVRSSRLKQPRQDATARRSPEHMPHKQKPRPEPGFRLIAQQRQISSRGI